MHGSFPSPCLLEQMPQLVTPQELEGLADSLRYSVHPHFPLEGLAVWMLPTIPMHGYTIISVLDVTLAALLAEWWPHSY